MKKMRLILPLADWPQVDRERWTAARTPQPLFCAENIAASWAPRRCKIVQDAYGRWLGWLAASDQLVENAPPEDRVSRGRVAAYIDHLRATLAPVSVGMMIGGLQRMLCALAPQVDWTWLRQVYSRLKASATPQRDKRPHLVSSADLYALGQRLIAAAEDIATPLHAATACRDGLLIALLAARPLRIRNLVDLHLGRSIVPTGDDWRLSFTAEETKAGLAIEVLLPADLTPALQRYLGHHRRVLLGRNKGTPGDRDLSALWVSRWGTKMLEHAVRDQIKLHTRKAFGRVVWPHLFRDCAATSLAVHDPDNVRLAAALLGHATFATTERYYNQATSLEAAACHQETLARLRREAPRGR